MKIEFALNAFDCKKTGFVIFVYKISIISLLLTELFSASGIYSQTRFRTFRDTSEYSRNNPDVKLFRVFNNINSSFLHTFTGITNESVIPVSAAVPLGMYTFSRINNNQYDESSSVLLLLSEITNFAATQGIKYLVKRNRPFRTLNDVKLFDTNSVAGTYSFPSGHSSGSFVIATSLTLRYPDNPILITGLYSYAVLVSLGRIYWGVHYPSDVLAGMLIGAGSAALIYSLRKPIIESKNKLFNQPERNERIINNNNTAPILLSVIAADFVNYFLSGSNNKFFSNSNINFDLSGSSEKIIYNLNF